MTKTSLLFVDCCLDVLFPWRFMPSRIPDLDRLPVLTVLWQALGPIFLVITGLKVWLIGELWVYGNSMANSFTKEEGLSGAKAGLQFF